MTTRALNFNAGPAALPLPVLQRVQAELLDYQGTGMSVLEMSHRSKPFETIINKAANDIKQIMQLSDDWHVLFVQGGGTGQFAAVPLNLLGSARKASYVVTGSWSKSAATEAGKYVECVDIVASGAPSFTSIPPVKQWTIDPESAYVHYCHNETIHGTEFDEVPQLGANCPPLVADLSSCFLSRPIVGIERLSVFYAGAQKNVGPAGLTIVGIRSSMLGKAAQTTPTAMNYTELAKASSLLNTPPCFSIYVTQLVVEWIKQQSLQAVEQTNQTKSQLLYQTIDQSQSFYNCPVEPSSRSRMNVVFRLPSLDLETAFIKEASQHHIIGIAGHRSVGGCRVSLYNAITLEQVQTLIEFMQAFQQKHQTA